MKQQHGGAPSNRPDLLDFSANLNPLGMPDSVRDAIRESAESCARYPDPFCTELCAETAIAEQIPPEQLVFGNGAADLIFRIVQTMQPKKALLAVPCFSEYEKALRSAGCAIRTYPLLPEHVFMLDDQFLPMLTPDLDMVFLCSPNNPTGRLITRNLLQKIAAICAQHQIMLICDECFLGLSSNEPAHSISAYLNTYTIRLTAFTKLYAIPGVRLGYAVCGSSEIAAQIRDCGQYWSVSAPAQAAGLAALKAQKYVHRSVKMITKEREYLTENLRSLGCIVYDSDTNFILFRTIGNFAEQMLNENILIRDCSNFRGLSPGYFRIAVRTHDENRLLIAAAERSLHG